MTALLYRLTPRTLRGRLSLVALTTATLLMVIFTVAFNAVAQQRLQHQADDQLRTRAAAVATTVDTSGPTVRVLETPTTTSSTRTCGSMPADACWKSHRPPAP